MLHVAREPPRLGGVSAPPERLIPQPVAFDPSGARCNLVVLVGLLSYPVRVCGDGRSVRPNRPISRDVVARPRFGVAIRLIATQVAVAQVGVAVQTACAVLAPKNPPALTCVARRASVHLCALAVVCRTGYQSPSDFSVKPSCKKEVGRRDPSNSRCFRRTFGLPCAVGKSPTDRFPLGGTGIPFGNVRAKTTNGKCSSSGRLRFWRRTLSRRGLARGGAFYGNFRRGYTRWFSFTGCPFTNCCSGSSPFRRRSYWASRRPCRTSTTRTGCWRRVSTPFRRTRYKTFVAVGLLDKTATQRAKVRRNIWRGYGFGVFPSDFWHPKLLQFCPLRGDGRLGLWIPWGWYVFK